MYLRGSKWSYKQRKRRSNPWRIIALVLLVSGALYVNQVVVPATPPLFVPTPTATRAPESYVTEAENLVRDGKLSQAIDAYLEAIQVNPNNPSNYIAIARLYIYTGNYPEAQVQAENALTLSPNNATAYALRGYAFALQGSYVEGEGSLQRAMEIEPSNAIPYAYMAETLALKDQGGLGDLGTMDQAIEYSRDAEERGPDLLETHQARGYILEITSNYEEAAQHYEAAIAINPNISDLHLALGRVYRSLEQNALANEEYQRASALNPTDPLPLVYISRTYDYVGETQKSIQYAEQAVKLSPTDAYLYGNLGIMQYRNLDYASAIESLRLAIQGGENEEGEFVEGIPLSNDNYIIRYYNSFGLALARQGQCGDALQVAQMILQTLPNDEISTYNANEMINICQELADSPGSPTLGSGTIEPDTEETQDVEEADLSGETPTP